MRYRSMARLLHCEQNVYRVKSRARDEKPHNACDRKVTRVTSERPRDE